MSSSTVSSSTSQYENPLVAGLGSAAIAACFTSLLPIMFGLFLKFNFGGQFTIDYEFWLWPIGAAAGFFGICTIVLVACRNAYRKFSHRQQPRLLTSPRRA
jgi:hypothetical protein